jgi:peptide-methionine (S)-S-oxide reductase
LALGLISAAPALATARSTPAAHPLSARADTAYFAGGCFWGIEAVYEHTRGVTSAVSGYSGGTTVKPSYEEVSTGETGHAESVKVIYDPSVVTYKELLEVFFKVAHDPTELNRQGPDHGTQYRSAIFYHTPEQKAAAESYVAELTRAKAYSSPIVTQIVPFKAFYDAEGYHQGYLASHMSQPYIVYNDLPKLEALKNDLPQLYRGK